jgi:hypothetical protein
MCRAVTTSSFFHSLADSISVLGSMLEAEDGVLDLQVVPE